MTGFGGHGARDGPAPSGRRSSRIVFVRRSRVARIARGVPRPPFRGASSTTRHHRLRTVRLRGRGRGAGRSSGLADGFAPTTARDRRPVVRATSRFGRRDRRIGRNDWWHERLGIMGPMFEERPVLLQEAGEGLVAIRLQASLEDQVVGSFEHVDGVDLHEPESLDQSLDRGRSGPGRGRFRQALCGEQDPPTLPRGELSITTSTVVTLSSKLLVSNGVACMPAFSTCTIMVLHYFRQTKPVQDIPN